MYSAATWVFPVAEKYTTRVRPVDTEAVPALVSSWVVVSWGSVAGAVVPSPSEAVVVSLPLFGAVWELLSGMI